VIGRSPAIQAWRMEESVATMVKLLAVRARFPERTLSSDATAGRPTWMAEPAPWDAPLNSAKK
jgi:hypothetical protein